MFRNYDVLDGDYVQQIFSVQKICIMPFSLNIRMRNAA